jgi:hypothetical protein
VLVREVRAHRVQARVHQGLEELVSLPIRHRGQRIY